MKKFIYSIGLFVIFATSLGLQAKKYPDRPLAQPNKQLSWGERFSRDLNDFILLENFGFHALSEKNHQFIQDSIHALEMDDYCIEVRGMSNYAKQVFGRMNAFVVPFSAFYNKSLTFLFISEEWFDSLTELERQSLVRHELMHVKCDHRFKKSLITLGSGAGVSLMYLLMQSALSNTNWQEQVIPINLCAAIIGFALINAKFSRICEKEADIEAAKTMSNKQGFIDLFNNFKDHMEDPESRFAVKRFINNVCKFVFTPLTKFGELFASHPTPDDRIAYIQELR